MSGTAEVSLVVIAVAVTVMALIQVGAIVAGLRVARRMEQVTTELRTSIQPVVHNLTQLTGEASRAAALATHQVERVDRAFSDLSGRLEQTLTMGQQLMSGPAREGMAILTGVRAAMSAFQAMRESSRRRSAARKTTREDGEEESLFIG